MSSPNTNPQLVTFCKMEKLKHPLSPSTSSVEEYSTTPHKASKKQNTNPNLYPTLPWVPKIIFPNGFIELEALTRSILESKEFEDAMNDSAIEFGKNFDAKQMPEEIVVVANPALDDRHLFGLVDQTLDPDKNTNYIHLSRELLENIRQQPGPNYELKFLACLSAVHETAHFLLRTAFQMRRTPRQFKKHHKVTDFGCFVEKDLLKKLELNSYGLLLFGTKEDFSTKWLDSKRLYSSLELGENNPVDVRLKSSYLKQIVNSKKFQAPTDDDIQELEKRTESIIVYRGEAPFRGYRGKCGFQP